MSRVSLDDLKKFLALGNLFPMGVGMSLFSWLTSLGKEPKAAGFRRTPPPPLRAENTWLRCTHDFCDDFIADGFDEVMVTVEMDPRTAKKLKEAIIANYDEPSRVQRLAAFKVVHGVSWAWPALAEWYDYFAKKGTFPLSWQDWLKAREQPAEVTFKDICVYIRKDDLRVFLESNGVELPDKLKKADMVHLGERLGMESLRPLFTSDKWFEVVVQRQHQPEFETLALLIDTIWRRTALLRNGRWCHRITGRENISPQNHRALSSDPVEDEFCTQWQAGELRGFPPFFPGDHSTFMLLPRQRHKDGRL